MGNPDFKDALRELIEKNGGLDQANLVRISDKIRESKPEFSAAYLRRLLSGLPPSHEDRMAISLVLEPPSERWMSTHWRLEELDSRRIAELSSHHTKNPEFIKESVDYVLGDVRYRDRSLSENDVKKLLEKFHAENRAKVEIDVFGLLKPSLGR